MNRVPPPDHAAHDDGRLMHELTVVNTLLGRYVLRFLDADAGRVAALSIEDERALAERLAVVAADLRARAARRERHAGRPSVVERQGEARQLPEAGCQAEE